jgi:acyl-CoA reductase-like NAD-dependent aldehyde dehydrogenase
VKGGNRVEMIMTARQVVQVVGPCLFDRVTPEMALYKDEIFGPVLSVVRAGSYDEALGLVNAAIGTVFTHQCAGGRLAGPVGG